MYSSIDFSSQSLRKGDPLYHKQGGLIHQFGIWLGRDLKNRLLLLLLYKMHIGKPNGKPHQKI
jgi:hypothetical protein